MYIDIDAAKEKDFRAIIYHLKRGNRVKPTIINPILFLSKCLTSAKVRYWPTELKMARIVWTVQKTHYIIRTAYQVAIIWTDYSAILSIAK